MDFISIAFLVFFVTVLICYYLIPKKLQWILLLAASYFFYMYTSPTFVVFLLLATLATYGSGILMGRINSREAEYLAQNKGTISKDEKKEIRAKNNKKKRWILVACLVITIGILAFMKYTNFFIDSINVFGFGFSEIQWLILPLGISFYTFQSAGYSIDVYRGAVEPQKNPFKYALFVSFFPQVLMGPIGRYNDLAPQLFQEHKFDGNQLRCGLERMLWGFFKKLVIANNIGIFVDMVYADVGAYSGFIIAVATVAFAIQLYADFSGFIDIAIGASQVMGIKLAENFKRPYFSRTVPEFWRRWHMTLGSWFKDYVFYAIMRTKWAMKIGLSLKKNGHKRLAQLIPTAITLIITWSLLGLWHGAEWHYVLFGAYYGLLMILGIIVAPLSDKTVKALHINPDKMWFQTIQIVRTLFLVCIGNILFKAATMGDVMTIIKQICSSLFSISIPTMVEFATAIGKWQCVGIVLGCILLFIVSSLEEWKNINIYEKFNSMKIIFRWPVLYVLVFSILLFGGFGTATFIYFQF